ncbi:MAG: SEC-C metal-binding domain-containing protein [Propionibacteriaceae bacterium]
MTPQEVAAATSAPEHRVEIHAKGLEGAAKLSELTYSAPDESGKAASITEKASDQYAGVGRNSPCPCGSGKKFKQCHGA